MDFQYIASGKLSDDFYVTVDKVSSPAEENDTYIIKFDEVILILGPIPVSQCQVTTFSNSQLDFCARWANIYVVNGLSIVMFREIMLWINSVSFVHLTG